MPARNVLSALTRGSPGGWLGGGIPLQKRAERSGVRQERRRRSVVEKRRGTYGGSISVGRDTVAPLGTLDGASNEPHSSWVLLLFGSSGVKGLYSIVRV